jgi:LacI family transcriptional regulator
LVITGAIQASYDENHRIPEDLSLIAVTSPHVAGMTVPNLTSVDIPVSEMGQIGAEILIRLIEGEVDRPIQRILRGQLTVRHSTGPCKRE